MAGLLLLLSWLPLSSARQGEQDVGISDRWRSPGAGVHLLSGSFAWLRSPWRGRRPLYVKTSWPYIGED